MNMNDYKHVTQRMHPSDACKHEILRAAAQNEQPRETRRQIFWKNLPVAAAGMAACLSLIVGGAFIWQNRADFAPRTQSQVPEVSAVTEEVGASLTTTVPTTMQAAEAQTETAAQVQTTAEVQAVSQTEEAAPAVSGVTENAATKATATVTTAKPASQSEPAQTSSSTLPSHVEEFLISAGVSPEEWVAELEEQVSQIFSSIATESAQSDTTTTTPAFTDTIFGILVVDKQELAEKDLHLDALEVQVCYELFGPVKSEMYLSPEQKLALYTELAARTGNHAFTDSVWWTTYILAHANYYDILSYDECKSLLLSVVAGNGMPEETIAMLKKECLPLFYGIGTDVNSSNFRDETGELDDESWSDAIKNNISQIGQIHTRLEEEEGVREAIDAEYGRWDVRVYAIPPYSANELAQYLN